MKKFLMFSLILILAGSLFAQLDRSKRPLAAPAPEFKIANAESFELSNGLKVFVVENHKLPRVAFSLMLDVDPVLEGKNAGFVSTAGQLLRKGTKNRSKDKLNEEIDFLGANLSTSATSIFASGLEKHKEKVLNLVADIILNSDFKQEELDKITKQTISGLASTKDDPNTISQRVTAMIQYGKEHPYGESESEESVKSITLDMCKNYYESYWRPNVAYLAIVGDINKAKAKALVEKYLGKWQKKDVPKSSYPTPKQPIVTKVALVDKANAVQSVVAVAYPVELQIGSPDAIKASVVNLILGGSATGRLFMNLREKHAYTYGAYSSLNADELVGSFTASTSVRNSVTDSAVTEILNEMKRLRNEKVLNDELQKAISYLSGGFIRSLEEPSTIARFAINTARFNLDKDYYRNYLKALNAVTADDVQEIAKKYIKPSNAHIVVVGKADEVAKNIAKFSVSGKLDYFDAFGQKVDPNAKKLPAGVTVESILNKYIDAIGGRDNWMKVSDLTMKLSGTVQGMNINITQIVKSPDKYYQLVDFGMGQQMSVTDGVKGKSSGMGQDTELTGESLDELKEQANQQLFLDYAKYGYTTELNALETIKNKDAYKVTITTKSGKKNIHYYDVETGLLVRTMETLKTPQGDVSRSTDMSDYKEVNGLKFPYTVYQDLGMAQIEFKVSSVLVNSGVQDSVFTVK